MESLQGQLLIAAPTLLDPNFRRTVVLVAAHSDEGAMGVVLNRPSELEVSEATDVLSLLTGEGELVHRGGPVQVQTVTVLAEFRDPDQAAALVLENVGFVPAESDFEELTQLVTRARVFAGHAGWGPEQLESELEREDWILHDASPDDVFAEDAESLWSEVLERKGGQYALVARMPPDPSVN